MEAGAHENLFGEVTHARFTIHQTPPHGLAAGIEDFFGHRFTAVSRRPEVDADLEPESAQAIDLTMAARAGQAHPSGGFAAQSLTGGSGSGSGLEQLAACRTGDRQHAGVGDAPLDGNGVEMLLDRVDRADMLDLVP